MRLPPGAVNLFGRHIFHQLPSLLVLTSSTHLGIGRVSQPMECSTAGPSHVSHYGAMLARKVTHPCINQAYDCLTSVIKHKTFAPCYVSPHSNS